MSELKPKHEHCWQVVSVETVGGVVYGDAGYLFMFACECGAFKVKDGKEVKR